MLAVGQAGTVFSCNFKPTCSFIPVVLARYAKRGAAETVLVGTHGHGLRLDGTGFASHFELFVPAISSAERQEWHLS